MGRLLAASVAVLALSFAVVGHAGAQDTIDPMAFRLSAADFPPQTQIDPSEVENNTQATANKLISHLSDRNFDQQGRLTGYFMSGVQVKTDSAGKTHGVLTQYFVSIFGTADQAHSAYTDEVSAWTTLVASGDATFQASAISPLPTGIGQAGGEAEYVSTDTLDDGTIYDASDLLFIRGRVFVQVEQGFSASDLDPYGTDAIPYTLSIARKLDGIAQQVQGAPASKPATGTFLLNVKSSGTHTTQSFKVPKTWNLIWWYDCTSIGSKGNFQVSLFHASGKPSANAGVNQLGMKGRGTEHYHHGGNLYLVINSTCKWQVRASA